MVFDKGRRVKYLWKKYNKCKALMEFKRAQIRVLESELDMLEDRKIRLGLQWMYAKKETDDA